MPMLQERMADVRPPPQHPTKCQQKSPPGAGMPSSMEGLETVPEAVTEPPPCTPPKTGETTDATSAAAGNVTPEDVLDSRGVPNLSAASSRWDGWCEIESDPAFFNVILSEWGVKGVRVHEVISLDDEMLAQIPKPVYGLIFLFRWMDHGDKAVAEGGSEDSAAKVWFSNQVPDNACATIALLNILMNAPPGVDTGEHLQQFKQFSIGMTPATRGLAIDNFQFIKDIHNSFGRKLDMLADDYELAEKSDVDSPRKRKRRRCDVESALHFNAFLPMDGELFKLDGLEERPCSLGPVTSENWLSGTRATLEDRMNACQTAEHEFAVLAVTRDPLADVEDRLRRVENGVSRLSARIKQLGSSWGDDSIDLGKDGDISTDVTDLISEESLSRLLASEEVFDMVACHRTLQWAQKDLHVSVIAERQSALDDEAKARNRRFDYEPAIRHWVSRLAQKGRLKDMLDWADKNTR